MAELTTKAQQIFGATGPTGVLGQFGSLKAGSPTYSNDPDVIQGLAAFGQGLSGAIINNAPPAIQDINSLFYLISRQIAYLMQTGIPEWNEDTTYYIGSFVSAPNGENGAIFISVTDDNIGNLLSDTSKWMLYRSNKFVIHTATNTYTALYDDAYIEMVYATTAYVILPEAVASNKGRIIHVQNNSTVNGSIVDISAAGSPASLIDGAAYFRRTYSALKPCAKFVSNGSSWDIIKRFG